jgi:MurNAc alpha-1-phosphate uridylyltransferase
MRAMILAAGRGERMRPLTDHTPKPLLAVGGKPLIVWHIQRLVAAGITQLVINHAWLGQRIEAALGSGVALGANIIYSPESGQALETAGGIAQALHWLGDEPFLVINGDIWCDWNPAQAQEIARNLTQTQAKAWVLLVPNPQHNPQGDFHLQPSGLVCAPDHDTSKPLHTFAGIGIYQASLFDTIQAGQRAALGPLLRQTMKTGAVRGSLHAGEWIDIGTPERLAALQQRLHGWHDPDTHVTLHG